MMQPSQGSSASLNNVGPMQFNLNIDAPIVQNIEGLGASSVHDDGPPATHRSNQPHVLTTKLEE